MTQTSQDENPGKPVRRWRKTTFAAAVFALAAIGFFAVFNTSTRYGRWLLWQDADWGDIDRFAYRTVAAEANSAEPPATDVDERTRQAISDFRVGQETLVEFAASHESTALIVWHDGAIVVEEYFQGYERDSLQSSFSCTKSVVSLLVGCALEEGLIDSVDDPITKYVEHLRPEFQEVSIRHLLTMTAGFSDNNEEFFGVVPAPWSDKVKSYYDPNCRRLARSFELDHAPGEQFEYHDFSPILIGMMLENVTGDTLSKYLSEKIWRPAGIQHAARWSLDSRRHGFEKPEVGLHARAIDFTRLAAMLVDPQQTVVSPEWLQQSILDEKAGELVKDWFAASAERARQRGDQDLAEHIGSIRYGFYWWGLERDGRYDFYANGHFGQFIYISPEARLVIVRNGTGHGGLNDWRFGSIFFNLASRVIDAN